MDLSGAEVSEAEVSGAILRAADLWAANLTGANLIGANLVFARLFETVFADTDLAGAQWLDTCHHRGPSTLDHRTIAKSWPLPLAFLRGCGLPDEFIEYFRSRSDRAERYYSCFISYATPDQAFAGHLYHDLQNNNVRCWYAPRDMQGGEKVHEQIKKRIREHDRLLLILSAASMNSGWVKTEIDEALQKEKARGGKVLFPIALVPFEIVKNWKNFDPDTGKDLAREIREYFIPDFSDWRNHDKYKVAFERLLRDLKAEEQRPSK